MARKLLPDEELAFFRALPSEDLSGEVESRHKNPLNRAPDSLPAQPPPERAREHSDWDEGSWPDEWGW